MSYRPQPRKHAKRHICLYRMILPALDANAMPAVVAAIVPASFGKTGFQVPIHLMR